MPHNHSTRFEEVDPADNPWFGTWETWDDVRRHWSQPGGNEDARAKGRALCDAMIAWRDGGPHATLDVVLAAIDSGVREISLTGAAALGRVLATRARPFEDLKGVWSRARARGRSRLAWCAGSICARLSEAEELEFRLLCLQDRSKVVRRDAAVMAGLSGFEPIIPALKELAAQDPDDQVRELAERSHQLLERGYALEEPKSEDAEYVWACIVYEDAIAGGGLQQVETGIRRAEIDHLGPDEAVAQVRRRVEEETREVFEAYHGRDGSE